MPRTTLDIDAAVLRELERRKARTGKTIGRLVSELLAGALEREDEATEPFSWVTRRMGVRVDLEDDESVRRALDER